MTTVEPSDVLVLTRGDTTTTYHFGMTEPICGEARGNTPAVATNLTEALHANRRLCRLCADLVAGWTSSILSVASSTHIVHPDR